MQITRQADYAVRAVLELARQPDSRRLTAEEIADRHAIPHAFLSKTLALLADAGIVSTQRGVKGGVRLNRPPGRISLLEVVEAVDGPIALNRCTLDEGACQWTSSCDFYPIWCTLRDEVRASLGQIDFEQVVRSPESSREANQEPARPL